MQLDIHDLRDFYHRPLGAIARRMLVGRVRARWRSARGLTVMGLGFASPYLASFRGEAARVGALMPAGQGAMVWPSSGLCQTVMVEEGTLPLPDASVDRLLLVHYLEVSENPHQLLREIWRVLAPEGRLLIIVPNRRGIWARLDTTPFGFGRPYSRDQLAKLLTQSLFTPIDVASALNMPPIDRPWLLRWAKAFERIGGRLWPLFSGVLMVEARKEVMTPLPVGKTARARRQLVTLPAPLRRDPSARVRGDDDPSV